MGDRDTPPKSLIWRPELVTTRLMVRKTGPWAQPPHHRAEVHRVSAPAEATFQPVEVPPGGGSN